ncbi:hypothetical protein AVEN_48169-1 [Araneus ventricosus]|uniref:Uncharacterized protein n=1 Tax=Araneus ventricosus TaxID=182803 RepID=A0A4Y2IL23_ARAVE|nr:hypothetical protein AVEN_48169-1 [Araneus ventricosus]
MTNLTTILVTAWQLEDKRNLLRRTSNSLQSISTGFMNFLEITSLPYITVTPLQSIKASSSQESVEFDQQASYELDKKPLECCG